MGEELYLINLRNSRSWLKTKPRPPTHSTFCMVPKQHIHKKHRGPLINMNLHSRRWTIMNYEIDLIREISWHRSKNRFYRACYSLLKELQEVTEQATDDLLLLYHSERSLPQRRVGYRPVTDIATKLQQDLANFTYRESEASDSWNELWNNR